MNSNNIVNAALERAAIAVPLHEDANTGLLVDMVKVVLCVTNLMQRQFDYDDDPRTVFWQNGNDANICDVVVKAENYKIFVTICECGNDSEDMRLRKLAVAGLAHSLGCEVEIG